MKPGRNSQILGPVQRVEQDTRWRGSSVRPQAAPPVLPFALNPSLGYCFSNLNPDSNLIPGSYRKRKGTIRFRGQLKTELNRIPRVPKGMAVNPRHQTLRLNLPAGRCGLFSESERRGSGRQREGEQQTERERESEKQGGREAERESARASTAKANNPN